MALRLGDYPVEGNQEVKSLGQLVQTDPGTGWVLDDRDPPDGLNLHHGSTDCRSQCGGRSIHCLGTLMGLIRQVNGLFAAFFQASKKGRPGGVYGPSPARPLAMHSAPLTAFHLKRSVCT